MKNYRIHYAVVYILTAVVVFAFSTRTAAAALLALTILPALSYIAFAIEAKGTALNTALVRKNGLELKITINGRPFSIALGGIYIKAEFTNTFFDIVKNDVYYIPLNHKGRTEALIPLDGSFCGNLKISFREITAIDILGLFRKDLQVPKAVTAVIYPSGAGLNAVMNKRHESSLGENCYDTGKRGGDIAEIFDLRAYVPGDSLRAIHRKLSAKTQSLIIREGSKSANFDTLLYIDLGKAVNGGEMKKEFMRSVAETGFYISESLISGGVRHNLALPSQNEIFNALVEDRRSYFSALEQALSLSAANVCGKWFESVPQGEITSRYSKLIYVAWEEYPKALELMSGFINITVIMLYDNYSKAMEAVDYNNLNVIAIGVEELYDSLRTIAV